MKVIVLIPSFNTGPLLRATVEDALQAWPEVSVVVDGSTDGSDQVLEEITTSPAQTLRITRLPENRGKGAALLVVLEKALQEGFTHALTLDSDGQHPVDLIPTYIEKARQHPEAMILGKPVFDHSAPAIRVQGRKLSNGMTHLQTLSLDLGDSLFGMRLYPIAPLLEVFTETKGARRFDFEPEVAVRLHWKGLPVRNIATPVRYLDASEGGVSQFRYWRDNVLLTKMHWRLLVGLFPRIPLLLQRKRAD